MRALALLALALPACAAEPRVPDWVLNPPTELGVAAGDCVDYSGNISIDRQQLAASARLALAQQLNVQVQAMDTLYSKRVSEGKETKLASSFESTSRQVVDVALKGSRMARMEIVEASRGKLLCGLAVIGNAEATTVAREVIATSGVTPSQETEEMLLAQFKARAASKQ